jgi:3-isopropylmalate dehydratase small subunit
MFEINFETGEIHDKTKDMVLKAKPLPKFVQKIVEKGGLVNFLRSEGYV